MCVCVVCACMCIWNNVQKLLSILFVCNNKVAKVENNTSSEL